MPGGMTLDIRQRQWPEIACAFHPHVVRAILDREREDPGLQVANVAGWHSRPDLFTWEQSGIGDLVDRIAEGARLADAGDLRVHAWANVMRSGAYQLAHRHGDARWSGVYYVESGEPGQGGEITFAAGEESRAMVPRTGLMLVFPGNLLHSVAVYRGARPRISIAFNLFP